MVLDINTAFRLPSAEASSKRMILALGDMPDHSAHFALNPSVISGASDFRSSAATFSIWRMARRWFLPAIQNVVIGISTVQKLSEKIGVACHVLQSGDHGVGVDIVKVGANADVIDARHFANVINVVGRPKLQPVVFRAAG